QARRPQPEAHTPRDVFPEEEGLPEVANDDSPTSEMAEDPEFAPLPGGRPGASADFGSTSLAHAARAGPARCRTTPRGSPPPRTRSAPPPSSSRTWTRPPRPTPERTAPPTTSRR